jgi:hypothetical protein
MSFQHSGQACNAMTLIKEALHLYKKHNEKTQMAFHNGGKECHAMTVIKKALH